MRKSVFIIDSDEVNIAFYSNEKVPLNLKIIYHKGRYHIESTEDIVLVDNNSEINILDEERKPIDVIEEANINNYELQSIKMVKTPSLSLKEKIKLSFNYLNKMKKRTLFLAIPLFVIVILVMFSIQNMITASFVDKKNIVHSDSHVYNVNIDKEAVELNRDVMMFGFEHMYNRLRTELPNIEPVLEYNTNFKFYLNSWKIAWNLLQYGIYVVLEVVINGERKEV